MAPVPPTTHAFAQVDRTRLIQSSRKIQEVVGETPLFLDIDPSSTPKITRRRLRRLPPLPFLPEVPPGLSLPTTLAPGAKPARPVLRIRPPGSDDYPIHVPPTPVASPTLTVIMNRPRRTKNDPERKRKTMAKLNRTLGVNVPPEIVFPAPKQHRRTGTPTIELAGMYPEPLPKTSESRPRKRAHGVNARAGGSRAVGRAASVRSIDGARAKSHRSSRHSDSESISRGWVWVGSRTDSSRQATKEALIHKWVQSVVDPSQFDAESIITHSDISIVRPMYRKGRGWSGNWAGNAASMEDIVQKLRTLKVK